MSKSQPPKLAVCNIRNPLDPAVWSRTPFNICRELESRGRLGAAISGRPHKSVSMQLVSASMAMWYLQPSTIREMSLTRPMRAMQARAMASRLAEASHVLHLAGDRHLPLAEKRAGSKHYLLLDTTWRDWARTRHPGGRFSREVDRVSREAYQQMDHLFPLGEYTRRSLIEDYGIDPRRITVVGSGRGAIEPFFGAKDYANGTILFVAKHGFRAKGGELLLEAFKIARRKNSNLKLWIVTDEPIPAGENVTTFGFLPLEKLQDLFNRASVYAMPGKSEPWGLVYLEALGCRTPILGLNVNAFPEFAADGAHGFIVGNPTPQAVAEKLVEAFSDPARLAEMGERGQKFCVEKFTWQRVVDTILDRVDHGDS